MTELDVLRMQMDEINNSMLLLFAERMELSGQIAEYKRENGLPIRDEAREQEILRGVSEYSGELGDYSRRFFETLMALSHEYQETLL